MPVDGEPGSPADGDRAHHTVTSRVSPAHRAIPRIGGVRPEVGLVIAFGMALVVVALVAGGHGPRTAAPVDATPAGSSVAVPSAVPSAAAVVVPAGRVVALRPTEVRLPRLGVDSALVDLDIAPDGTLSAPPDPDVAGWFVRGAVPGEAGPAVIAGHVDSRTGPAVFYRLDQLTAGDRVEVTRSDGKVFAYTVATVETHPKDAFPTARVYGPTPGPELRLITCGGEFDRSSRHYRDNVIVTAIPA
jgi:hypothetical protein